MKDDEKALVECVFAIMAWSAQSDRDGFHAWDEDTRQRCMAGNPALVRIAGEVIDAVLEEAAKVASGWPADIADISMDARVTAHFVRDSIATAILSLRTSAHE